MQIFVVIVPTLVAVTVAFVHDVIPDVNEVPFSVSLPYGPPLKIYSSTKGDLSLQYACKDGRVSACKCIEYTSRTKDYNSYNYTGSNESEKEELDEFPHLAFIGSNKSSSICCGSLISPRFVLTTGSCNMEHDNKPEFITLGSHNPGSLDESEALVKVSIKEIYKESGLISPVSVNDFIILELVSEVPLSANIKPACLWTMEEVERQTKLQVSGLKNIPAKGPGSYEMHKASASIVNKTECNGLNKGNSLMKDRLLSDICVQETVKNKLNSCKSRTGSPMQFVTKDDKTCIFYLIAMNTISDDSCDDTLSIFTKTLRSLDWIESVVWPGLDNRFGELDFDVPHISFLYDPPMKISSPTKDLRIQNACNSGRVSACKCIEYTRGTECKNSYNYMDSDLFENAELGEFPHLVFVGRNTTNVYESVSCSGSLISPKFVLTTGGCLIEHQNKPEFVTLADLGPDFSIKDGTTPVQVPIKKIHRKIDSKAIVNFNELILLELVSEVSFSTKIRPACLWTEKRFDKEAKYLVAGLERLHSKQGSTIGIRKASVSIVKETICNSTYGFYDAYFDERLQNKVGNICVWETPIDDLSYRSCKTIAGSPMQTVTRDENSCIFNILAVNIVFDHYCSGSTSLFTTVSRDIEWIESVVWPGDSH